MSTYITTEIGPSTVVVISGPWMASAKWLKRKSKSFLTQRSVGKDSTELKETEFHRRFMAAKINGFCITWKKLTRFDFHGHTFCLKILLLKYRQADFLWLPASTCCQWCAIAFLSKAVRNTESVTYFERRFCGVKKMTDFFWSATVCRPEVIHHSLLPLWQALKEIRNWSISVISWARLGHYKSTAQKYFLTSFLVRSRII